MRLLRSWGERRRYEHSMKGFNYRMDGIQGAILRVKLKHLDDWIDARRNHARMCMDSYSPTRLSAHRASGPGCATYQQYSVRLSQRDSWRTHLGEIGIQTAIHYPIPVHLQPAYRDLGYARVIFRSVRPWRRRFCRFRSSRR